jgi:hypothetical protein
VSALRLHIFKDSRYPRPQVLLSQRTGQRPFLLLSTFVAITPYIRFLSMNRLEHMGGRSSYYNAVLVLGATAVDNGKGGGWEKIRGNHGVKLNGRTYHFIPKTGSHCQGGIQYFTYDAASKMEAYTESLNTPNGRHGERTVREYLRGIYEELKEVNELVNECEQIGIMAGNEVLGEGDARALKLAINVKTSAFDVAAITSDATTGERVLTYKLKGERCAKKDNTQYTSFTRAAVVPPFVSLW